MKVDGVVVGCVVMSVWLYMNLLCMSMSIFCYACRCLYFVMHALSWLWLCMNGRLDMHCEFIV